MTARGRWAGVLVGAALALGCAGCGSGGSSAAAPTGPTSHQRVDDPRGDVWTDVPDEHSRERRNVDVVRTDLWRSRTALHVRATYADLRPHVGQAWDLYLLLTTSRERRRTEVYVEESALFDRGRVVRWERTLGSSRSDAVDSSAARRCPRPATYHLDFVRNTVEIVVPDPCLGRPRWVRVVRAEASVDRPGREEVTTSVDNLFAGFSDAGESRRLVRPRG